MYEEQEFFTNASVPMEMTRMQYEKVRPSCLLLSCLGMGCQRELQQLMAGVPVQLAVAINMGTNLPSCATPNGEC